MVELNTDVCAEPNDVYRCAQTKPVDLGCESAENWQLSSTLLLSP